VAIKNTAINRERNYVDSLHKNHKKSYDFTISHFSTPRNRATAKFAYKEMSKRNCKKKEKNISLEIDLKTISD
jgi:hypothetical protein